MLTSYSHQNKIQNSTIDDFEHMDMEKITQQLYEHMVPIQFSEVNSALSAFPIIPERRKN